ncbi:hypothetical protein GA0115261_111592 [Streptomyces sp. OspMP-M43]|nr:hypothetical protein GA0115261_111592 [Streptomyces sp. OspMP-M43]
MEFEPQIEADKLSADQLAALAKLGMDWAAVG